MKKFICILLVLTILYSFSVSAFANSDTVLDNTASGWNWTSPTNWVTNNSLSGSFYRAILSATTYIGKSIDDKFGGLITWSLSNQHYWTVSGTGVSSSHPLGALAQGLSMLSQQLSAITYTNLGTFYDRANGISYTQRDYDATSISSPLDVAIVGIRNIAKSNNYLVEQFSRSDSLLYGALSSIKDYSPILDSIDSSNLAIQGYVDGLETINTNIKNNTDSLITVDTNIKVNTDSLVSNTSDLLSAFNNQFKNTNLIRGSYIPARGNVGQSWYAYDTRNQFIGLALTDNTRITSTEYNQPTTVSDVLVAMYQNLLVNTLSVKSFGTNYSYNPFSISDGSTGNPVSIGSVMDYLSFLTNGTTNYVGRLAFVLADDDTIARKKDTAETSGVALDEFTSSNGKAKADKDDFTALSGGVSDIKDSFNGADSVHAFDTLSSDSEGWGWFSQATVDSLDSSPEARQRSINYTPLYNQYMETVLTSLKVGN